MVVAVLFGVVVATAVAGTVPVGASGAEAVSLITDACDRVEQRGRQDGTLAVTGCLVEDQSATVTYEATLAAAEDRAGNAVETSPSAVAGVVGGGMGTTRVLGVGALAALGVGGVVVYRRLLG